MYLFAERITLVVHSFPNLKRPSPVGVDWKNENLSFALGTSMALGNLASSGMHVKKVQHCLDW